MAANRPTFSPMAAKARQEPLGPIALNQAAANIEAIDAAANFEHLEDGTHNAVEIPWVLGHVDGTTGYLFDTAYGGGTITNPATGRFTCSVASGVLTTPSLAILANVNDTAVETKPHTITWEALSSTSVQVRIRELSSALGAGNTWADVNRDFDIAVFAPPTDYAASRLNLVSSKQRRDFLTGETTSFNNMVRDQALLYDALTAEHTSGGNHNLNRIARAVAWVRPDSPTSYAITISQRVSSVSRVGTGQVSVNTSDTFSSTSNMAALVEVQPGTADELVVAHVKSNTTSQFRVWIYAYSGGNWARVDRPFFVTMFGAI